MEHITIKADEGKVWRRISDGFIAGNEITLGYTWYINGEKLEKPLWELPEHYEQIDDPYVEEIEENEFIEENNIEEVTDYEIA